MTDAPSTTAPADGEVADRQDYKLEVADKRYAYKTQPLDAKDKAKLQAEILEALFAHDAAPLYEDTCADLGWTPDAAKLASMRASLAARVAAHDAAAAEAAENEGDVEVRDALVAKAAALADAGEREGAVAAYAAADAKTAGTGLKLDSALALARLDMAYGDWRAVKGRLTTAAELAESGGDWERRNRLKMYQAATALATRDTEGAAGLLVDGVSTFTATELFSYDTAVFYAVVTAVATLPRPDLKARVVDAPEVLAVTARDPPLASLAADLHGCRYAPFFAAFAVVVDRVAGDRLLGPHARHWARDVRATAFRQFLEPYTSVTLAAMATAFGVSPAFVEAELADLVADGRVAARVDAVAGVVEAARADAKAAAYAEVLAAGDVLLNRLQRLAKVADAE